MVSTIRAADSRIDFIFHGMQCAVLVMPVLAKNVWTDKIRFADKFDWWIRRLPYCIRYVNENFEIKMHFQFDGGVANLCSMLIVTQLIKKNARNHCVSTPTARDARAVMKATGKEIFMTFTLSV